MIKVRQIKISIYKDTKEEIRKKISLKLKRNDILSFKISKKSIDARDKNNIMFVYEVIVSLKNEKNIKFSNDVLKYEEGEYTFPKGKDKKIVIVGAGPAGLFAGYMLATHGYKPIIIERGEKLEKRAESVEEFWKSGKLNLNSNAQFGEGGAGTFSDGKLNTLVKDKDFLMKKVFEIFVLNGAPEEILYLNKPHVGTDKLMDVVKNMREKILSCGGEIKYNTCLTDIFVSDSVLKGIELNNKDYLEVQNLLLAPGHSARDTFEMLNKKVKMSPKPFAVGVRVSHKQSLINKSQYGTVSMPPASYKLTYNTNNRGVYSFCMCPGGYVVNASSEDGYLVINGMSNYKRDSKNANSAIVVTVGPSDYGTSVLDGINFQRNLEKKAFELGNGKIPVQLFKDFKENKESSSFGEIKPIFKGDYAFANLNKIFPDYISSSLKEGITYFDSKIKGFASDDVIIAGVESRTSSPVRIDRDENYESSVKGIFPAGEGSGYAGGIVTSAMDGIRVAHAILKK